MKKIYVVFLDSRDEYAIFFGAYLTKEQAEKRIEELEEEYPEIDYIEFIMNENCCY